MDGYTADAGDREVNGMGIPWWGYVLIVAAAIGAAVGLVVNALQDQVREHNPRTCKCFKCRNRRDRIAAKKRLLDLQRRVDDDSVTGMPMPQTAEHYISTTRLEANTKVVMNGQVYLVKNIRTDAMGYLVELRAQRDRQLFVVTVRFSYADQKIWEPLPYWR